MNRERAKELLPIIQAFADGAEIQFRSVDFGEWTDIVDVGWDEDYMYRVKPQPTLRPFTPQEAFEKTCGRDVRDKDDQTLVYRVYCTDEDGANLLGPAGAEWVPLERLLNDYEFTDGTPCGVRE